MPEQRLPASQLDDLPVELLEAAALFGDVSVRDPEGNFYAQSFRLQFSLLQQLFIDALPSVANGREVELRSIPIPNGITLEWRYVGDPVWESLGNILNGEDGDGSGAQATEIELRSIDVTGGRRLEWRYVDSVTWVLLDVILDGADGVSEVSFLSGSNLTLPALGNSLIFFKSGQGIIRVGGYYGFDGVEGVVKVDAVSGNQITATNVDIVAATVVTSGTLISSAGKPGSGTGGGSGGGTLVNAITTLNNGGVLSVPAQGSNFTFTVTTAASMLVQGGYQFASTQGVFKVLSKAGSIITAINISIPASTNISDGTVIGPAGFPGLDGSVTFGGSAELAGSTSMVIATENADWATTLPNVLDGQNLNVGVSQTLDTIRVGRGVTTFGNLPPTWSSERFLISSSSNLSAEVVTLKPILSAAREYRFSFVANARTVSGAISTRNLLATINGVEIINTVIDYSTTTWGVYTSPWVEVSPHIEAVLELTFQNDTAIDQAIFLGPYKIEARVPSGGLDAVTYVDELTGVIIPVLGANFSFDKKDTGILAEQGFYTFAGTEGAFQVTSVTRNAIVARNISILFEPTIANNTLITPSGPPGPSGPGGDMNKAVYDTTNAGYVDRAAALAGVELIPPSQYYGTNPAGAEGFHNLPVSGDASALTTGELDDARLSTNVTLQGNLFNGPDQLVMLEPDNKLPALDASNLTNVPAVLTAELVLTGNVSIASPMPNRIFLDPNGANRDVTISIPVHSEVWVTHIGTANTLILKDGATTVATLVVNDIAILTRTSVELQITIL